MLKLNLDKTSQKVTKDPKIQERGKKLHETYMKRLKEQILEDNQLPTPSPMGNSTPTPPPPGCTPSPPSPTGDPVSSTPSHAARPNDTYFYGVGILAVLANGVCVFFAYNSSQAKNKKTCQ